MNSPRNIILSRTDSVGDMVLALPMAAALKTHFPDITIAVLGSDYAKPIVDACSYVDAFIGLDEFFANEINLNGDLPECLIHVLPRSNIAKRAKQLGIKMRIGTTNRLYHWWTCNQLVPLSRNRSEKHEAQLNLTLLKPLGLAQDWSLAEIARWPVLNRCIELPDRFAALLQADKFKLILHPKSRGSAREWSLDYYAELIAELDSEQFQIFISGTAGEKDSLQPLLEKTAGRATDIVGLMSLPEFIAFIAACDGLVACSTGPLHIAAALGKHALGLYPPMHPIHPQRWAPVGPKAQVFVLEKECSACRKDKSVCWCMQTIQPKTIKAALEGIYNSEWARAK